MKSESTFNCPACVCRPESISAELNVGPFILTFISVMLPRAQSFVFTNFLAVSDITITHEEPETVIYGLYSMLATNETKELVIECDFAKLNDLLDLADFVEDASILQLSDIIASRTDEPATLDFTEYGGLNFTTILFCLEPVQYDDEDGDAEANDTPSYYMHSFIKDEHAVYGAEPSRPNDPQSQIDFYLYALTIQYRFYLHFLQRGDENELARQYANLEDEIVFQLAKTSFEMRRIGKA